MTLDKQITIGFLVMLLLIVIVSVFCMYSINSLKHTKSKFGEQEYTISEIISQFTDDEDRDGDTDVADVFSRQNLYDAIKITNSQIGVAYLNILIVASLAILFGGILTVLFPKRVTRPILRLVDATVNVREGDYSYRVKNIEGTDEIAKLVSSFNKMLNSIESEHEQLEERNAELKEKNDLNNKLLEETKNFNTTLRQKIEEVKSELDSKHMELMRSEKLATIGEIATRVAHEIRNPLSGIAVALENLRSDSSHEPRDKMVAEIITEVNRLDGIIKELFQLAMPREISLVPGNPNELVDRVVSLLRPEAQSKEIEIVKELESNEKEINLDYELMQRVLTNLMKNAIESVKANEGKVTISTSYQPSSFNITMTDNGYGIPSNDRDRIFQPFFTSKKEGTGLGLAVSKSIVEIHNGTITAENAEGSGSKFIITLPTNLKEADVKTG
jgi:two-component system NtrC family sensor kinase